MDMSDGQFQVKLLDFSEFQVAEADVEERVYTKEKNWNVVHFTGHEAGYLKDVEDGFQVPEKACEPK
jgi:hypothetical protein